MLIKKKFLVTFEMEFELNPEEFDEFDEDIEELKSLTADELKQRVGAAFSYGDSYEYFGESLSMIGMLTPSIKSVKEVK